jgi:hypothetical protein
MTWTARLTVIAWFRRSRQIISIADHLPWPANVSSCAPEGAQRVPIHQWPQGLELHLQRSKPVDYIVEKMVTGTLAQPVCSALCNNCSARSILVLSGNPLLYVTDARHCCNPIAAEQLLQGMSA